MYKQDFYEGVYRDVQDTGASGWYVRKSHKRLENGVSDRTYSKVLEVGGNIGEQIKYVVDNYSSYILTEYRQTGFISPNGKIKFRVADVQNLPFNDDSFDRTISTCLLHHLDNPKKALEEMRRETVPSGLISILVPCDPGLAYRFAKSIGPSRKWRHVGITNPSFYHSSQHRNHLPGIDSTIQEVFSADELKTSYWPFRIKTWNMNLFTVSQIRVRKE
jgi:SAM-dependent methyltransferase